MLNLAYYTDEELGSSSCSVRSSGDESSIIRAYESSIDDGTEENDEFVEALEDKPFPGGTVRSNFRTSSAESDFSFKCLGESKGFGGSLFRSESEWLRAPSRTDITKSKSSSGLIGTTTPVEHDIEGWLSDTSSVCEDSHDVYVRVKIHVFDILGWTAD